ncbi:MAG: hypothetical protein ACW99G_01310 [Candidatus Thorarchaeota archaeon]|jgi:hypothetical protein
MPERYYAESDGPPWQFYVIDRYGDPMQDHDRTDVVMEDYCTRGVGMNRARKLAKEFNENPPYPVWDTIQAERDGYKEK